MSTIHALAAAAGDPAGLRSAFYAGLVPIISLLSLVVIAYLRRLLRNIEAASPNALNDNVAARLEALETSVARLVELAEIEHPLDPAPAGTLPPPLPTRKVNP